MISDLKSLIHFKLIFVSGVRQGSSLFLSHVNIQFSQHHLLKRLDSPHWVFWIPCQILVTIYAWVYIWALHLVRLVYMPVFISIPYCFNYYCFFRKCYVSSFSLLSQDSFGYSIFYGSIWILGLFPFPWKCHWNFCRNALNLQMALDCMDILILILLRTQDIFPFISVFSLISVFQLLVYRYSTCLVKFFSYILYQF